jgi:hypothetical protein
MKKIIFFLAVMFLASCESCLSVDVDGNIDHYHYVCVGEDDAGQTFEEEDADQTGCMTIDEYMDKWEIK